MRGMQAGRQQRTTAKADSAAEHRRLLRCFTRTIRAGETTQQTVCSGVAYAANARMLRCSRQRQEAGQWEGVASRRRAAFLCCMFQRIRRESYAAKAAFGVRARKLTKGEREKGKHARAAYACSSLRDCAYMVSCMICYIARACHVRVARCAYILRGTSSSLLEGFRLRGLGCRSSFLVQVLDD